MNAFKGETVTTVSGGMSAGDELIIKALKKAKNPVILFSGGKDSTTVLHKVRSHAPNTPAMFNNTGVEDRETIKYVHSIKNIIVNKPEITFWDCVEKYGWPGTKASASRHGNSCCYHLKEKPGDIAIKKHGFDLVFTGLTAAESRQRRLTFKRIGPYYYAKTQGVWKCHPIWDWTEEDVWDYINSNDIPYNKGYDSGWKRCGCMPCTAHNKWQERLARENPKLLKIVLRKRYGQMQCGDFYGFGHDLKHKGEINE